MCIRDSFHSVDIDGVGGGVSPTISTSVKFLCGHLVCLYGWIGVDFQGFVVNLPSTYDVRCFVNGVLDFGPVY